MKVTREELPPPPAGRRGWPWTEGGPAAAAETGELPRISVVTPSYNQAAFLEETLRSVLLQGDPALEYLVVDGASDDGSGAILERYAPWLEVLIREPDHGQSDALGKGFARAGGEWIYWLNSDDVLSAGALARLRPHLAGARWLVTRPAVLRDGEVVERPAPAGLALDDLLYDRVRVSQPSVILHREVVEACGPPDPERHYAMDFDYWLRVFRHAGPPRCVDLVLGLDRVQSAAKTVRFWYRYDLEMAEVAQAHAARLGADVVDRRSLARSWRRRSAPAWSAAAAAAAARGARGAALAALLRALGGDLASVRRGSFRSALKAVLLGAPA